jgi:hypothetical protein
MRESERHRLDQLLDFLAEEVAERLRAGSRTPESPTRDAEETDRVAAASTGTGRPEETSSDLHETTSPPVAEGSESAGTPEPVHAGDAEPEIEAETELEVEPEAGLEPEPEGSEAEPALERMEVEPGPTAKTPSRPSVPPHTARLLGRLALGLLVLVVLINIPINRHGTTLATAMPDSRALVIRNGLVVKEEDDPETYVYEDGEFRWISSLDAFEYRGYTWEDVHIVDDGFLEDYAIGAPIHVLLKCDASPHIYRIEGEEKRWIVDIEAFEAEGHVWDDVQFVSCGYLRNLPDGETIPPGHGPPPQP